MVIKTWQFVAFSHIYLIGKSLNMHECCHYSDQNMVMYVCKYEYEDAYVICSIYNHYLKETKDAQRWHYGFIEIWQCKFVCQQKYDESVLISSVLLWVAKDHLLPNLLYVGWRREDEDREKEVIGYVAGGERTRTRWGLETGERKKKNHCYHYHCDLMY